MIHDAVVHKITRRNPFLQDWPYYGIIDILNPVATAQYQHAVTIPTKPGMMHDFRDLRFFQADGTEMPFWNESKTDGSTSFNWIKPYSASQRKAYVFYGNREAVSQSNGDRVFEFFDDFNSLTLNTGIWDHPWAEGSITQSNSIATITAASGKWEQIKAKSIYGLTEPFVFESSLKALSESSGSFSYVTGARDSAEDDGGALYFDGSAKKWRSWGNSSYTVSTRNISILTTFHTLKICFVSASNVKYSIDGTEDLNQTSGNLPSTTASLLADIVVYASTVYLDWVRTRKYAATEPVCQLNQSGLRNPTYR